MLYNILVFFSFLQSIIGFTLMSSATMRFKKPVKKRMIIAFSLMFILMLLYLLAFRFFGIQMENYAIIVIFFTFLLWYLICSRDGFFASVFNFLTFINIYIAISYFGYIFTIHSSPELNVLEYILIRGVIWTGIIYVLYRFVKKPFNRLVLLLYKEWRVATLVPLIFIILQISLLYYPVSYWRWESNSWYAIIIIIVYLLFIAVYYLIYVQANAIVEKYSLEKQKLLVAEQNKLWESELDRQKNDLALAAQQRHDMHHHNSVIMEMVRSKDMNALEAYINSFDNSLDGNNGKIFCPHPIINSLLNSFEKRARENSIIIKVNAAIPNKIGIENIDLVCILGNVLENAIEGSLRNGADSKKEIIFTAKFSDNRLRVKVENFCLPNIQFNEEFPISQKKGGGVGIKSIVYTAERYDGTAGFFVRDGKFISQIVLNAH